MVCQSGCDRVWLIELGPAKMVENAVILCSVEEQFLKIDVVSGCGGHQQKNDVSGVCEKMKVIIDSYPSSHQAVIRHLFNHLAT